MKQFNFDRWIVGLAWLAASFNGRAQGNGQLAMPVITWANPAPIVYGTALGSNQLNASASVPGSYVYAMTNGAAASASTNPVLTSIDPTGIYVDSVAGNDSNTGTYFAPLKTLAAVTVAATNGNPHIYGKAGSVFREQWQIPVNASVYAYGTGAKPSVNGSDIVSNYLFALAPGRTNTYQATVAPAVTTNLAFTHFAGSPPPIVCSNVLQVWDNSVRINVCAPENTNNSPALVDATPGSWWWNVTNSTLYVHPSDNSNPANNGRLYEVSTRTLAIWGSSNTYMENWVGEKASALVLDGQQGYGILGMASGYFKWCEGRHAYYHALGVDCTNVFAPLVFDSCYGFDVEDVPRYSTTGQSVTFVGCNCLVNQTNPVSVVIFTNCAAVQPSYNYGTNGTFPPTAYYAHGAPESRTIQDATTVGYIFNCYAENFGAIAAELSDSISSVSGLVCSNCNQGVVVQHPYSTNVTISGLVANGALEGVLVQNTTNYTVAINGSAFYNCYFGVYSIFGSNCPIAVTNCIFGNTGNSNTAFYNQSGSPSNQITSVSNSFFNIGSSGAYNGGKLINSIAFSDFNNYYNMTRIADGCPVNEITLANWVSANPTFDAHSTATNPAYAASIFTAANPVPTAANDSVLYSQMIFLTNGAVLNAGTNALSMFFAPSDTVDYYRVEASVSLVVLPAPLNVSANNASRVYGTGNPVFIGTITGLQNGDNITANYSTTATNDSPAGTYPIIPSLVDPENLQTNYTVTLDNATLTVLPATPVVIWTNPAPAMYGTALCSNQLNAVANMPGGFVYSPTNGMVLTTGTNTLSVVFAPADTVDYYSVEASVSLFVLPAPLSVSVNNASRVYGTGNPVFTGTITGLQNGDNIMANYGTTATNSSPVGTYPIIPSLADPESLHTNYTVTLNNGTLTVLPAASMVIWTNPTPVVYGTALGSNQLYATANVPGGFVYSPTNGVVLTTGTNTLSVVFTPVDTVDYNSAEASVSLEVLPALLTVTANNTNQVYGTGNPEFTGTIAGLQNGDNITANYSTTATNGSPAGTYPIIPSLADPENLQTNYTVTLNNGTLTVLPAAPMVIWTNPAPVVYGTALGSNQLNATVNVPGSFVYSPTNGVVLTTGTNTLSVVFTPVNTVDYNSAEARVSLAVLPAPLSVSANNASRVYGTGNPVFTGTITGLQNGDSITATYSTTATNNSEAGTYPITPSLVDPENLQTNYTVTLDNGTLTVQAATPMVIWTNPAPVVYGTALGSNQLNATANVPGGFVYSPTNGVVLTTGTNTLSVVFTPVDAVDYNSAEASVSLEVLPAPLTVTANDTNQVYGTTNPEFTGKIAGLQNGDNITANYSTTATNSSPVGTYPIIPSLADPENLQTNYTVTLNNGTLTVLPAAPMVIWTNPAPVVYGTALGSNQLNATVNVPGSFVYSPTNGVVLTTGTNTLSVVFTPVNTVDYNSAEARVSLAVLPAPLSVSANNASRVYGTGNPVFTGTITGLQNGDSITATYSTTATNNSEAGTYPITPSLVDPENLQTNYTVTLDNGTLTVQAATPVIIWTNPAPVVYGAALGTNQLNAAANMPGSFVYGPTNGVVLTTGTNTLSVVFTPVDTVDYNSAEASVSLEVLPAPLTVTANDTNQVYGTTNPEFTGKIAGLQNGDNITANYSTTATNSSPVGTYPIIPSLADPENLQTNYTVTLNNGTLTVLPAAPMVIWTNPAPVVYGTALGSNQLNATVNVPGSFVYSPTNGVVLTTGTNTLSVVFTPVDTVDYNSAEASVSLVMLPAALTVTPNNTNRICGTVNPVFTGTITGLQNGDNITANYSTTATNSSPAGNYPIIPSLADPENLQTNYTVTLNIGTLTVLPSAPLVVWTNPAPVVYGTALGSNQLNASASVAGSFAYNPTNGAVLNAGTNILSLVFTPTDTAGYNSVHANLRTVNYNSVEVNMILDVLPAPLSVTANNTSRVYGAANPAFTGTITGLQNGDNITATYSTTATDTSPVGTYPIFPRLMDPENLESNYTVTLNNGTLMVVAAPGVPTHSVTDLTATSATLNSTVNPNGAVTAVYFIWGPSGGSGNTNLVADLAAGTAAITVSNVLTGLAPHTDYDFQVMAVNALGTTVDSLASFATLGAPETENVAVSAVTTSSALLNGSVNSRGASTGAWFAWGTTSNYGQSTTVTNIGSAWGYVAVSNLITGLSPGTTHHFMMFATNSAGATNSADVAFTTLAAPPGAQTEPATDVAATSATLNCLITPNGAGTVCYFQWGVTTGYGSVSRTQSVGVGATGVAASQSVSGLLPGTTYHFNVVATNSAGPVQGGDMTFTTPALAPSIPTHSVTDLTATSATLNGAVNPNGAVTAVYFIWGPNGGSSNTNLVADLTAGTVAITVSNVLTGLAPHTGYDFQVMAVNALGTTVDSLASFATLGAPETENVGASSVTSTSAVLTGSVNARGASTGAWFAWGTTSKYGQATTVTNIGSAWSYLVVSNLITGLNPGTTYHFMMLATNSVGATNSADVEFATPAAPPGAQTEPGTDVAATSATLNALITPNGAGTVYYFQWGVAIGYGSVSPAHYVGVGAAAVAASQSVKGLLPGTTYHFNVVATNSAGLVQGGDSTFTTPALAPSVPTHVVTDLTTTSATLNATVNPNGAVTAVYFIRGPSGGSSNTILVADLAAGTAAITVSNVLTGLAAHTGYNFQVMAVNAVGTTVDSLASFATLGAPETENVGASSVTSTSALLSGSVNARGASTGAWFAWGTTSNFGQATTVTNIGNAWGYIAVSNLITGLSPGTIYHFMMLATNSVGATNSADVVFVTGSPLGKDETAGGLVARKPSALPLRILGVLTLTDGTRRIELTGTPGQTYVVQVANNLATAHWIVVSTNTVSASGHFSFTDPQSDNAPCRFYRLQGP